MTGSRPAMVLAIGLLAMLLGGAAHAQDLSAGKTPAQIFHSNCAMCHKSPRGLAAAGAKAGGMLGGLESFLAEHYTASAHSAEIIAAYLKSVDNGRAPAPRRHPHRNAAAPHKPDVKPGTRIDTAKKDEKKKGEQAVDKSAAVAPKSAEKKPAASKPGTHDEAKRAKPAQKKTD